MQKELRERHWKEIVQKHKIKDNGLQKWLATYEKVGECEFVERIRVLANIGADATVLKKAKELLCFPSVVNYLEDVIDAVKDEQALVQKDAKSYAQGIRETVHNCETRIESAMNKANVAISEFCNQYDKGLNAFGSAMRDGAKSEVKDPSGFDKLLEKGFEAALDLSTKLLPEGKLAKPVIDWAIKQAGKNAIERAHKAASAGGAGGDTYHDLVVRLSNGVEQMKKDMQEPMNKARKPLKEALSKAVAGCGADTSGVAESFSASVEAFADGYDAALKKFKYTDFQQQATKWFIDSRKGDTEEEVDVGLGVNIKVPGRKSGVLNFGLYVTPVGDGWKLSKRSPKWKLVLKGSVADAQGAAQSLQDLGFNPANTEYPKRIHLYVQAGVALGDGVLNFPTKDVVRWSSIEGDKELVARAWEDSKVRDMAMSIKFVEGDNK